MKNNLDYINLDIPKKRGRPKKKPVIIQSEIDFEASVERELAADLDIDIKTIPQTNGLTTRIKNLFII